MKIKLSEIIDKLDMVSDETSFILDAKTGQIHDVIDGFVDGEFDPGLEDYIIDENEYIALPDKYEINDYEIMRAFAYDKAGEQLRIKLLKAFSGRGAFRRFRDAIDEAGVTSDWYEYKEASYEAIAREWAARYDVEIEEDIESKLSLLEEADAEWQPDFDYAESYWINKGAKAAKMPVAELLLHMENFVKMHKTCALATGCDGFVRCTPIEYTYLNGAFYMLSEGGLKFHALRNNTNVCVAIYDEYKSFSDLAGMQVNGTASFIEPGTEEYYQILDFKKIPRSAFDKMPRPMTLIKVTPTEIEYINSKLKDEGYEIRQHMEL